jgi:hypothetical protein
VTLSPSRTFRSLVLAIDRLIFRRLGVALLLGVKFISASTGLFVVEVGCASAIGAVSSTARRIDRIMSVEGGWCDDSCCQGSVGKLSR